MLSFSLQFLAVVIGLFLVAYAAEKYAAKRAKTTERILSTRKIAMIGMFSAIAAVLMLFEIPMPFAPGFYKLDFSELPALILCFCIRTGSGCNGGILQDCSETVVQINEYGVRGRTCKFCGRMQFPASGIHHLSFQQNKKDCRVRLYHGNALYDVFWNCFNAIYLPPKFAQLYGMPMEALIGMGTAINGAITGITSFVCFAVAPLNLIKGASVSIITPLRL